MLDKIIMCHSSSAFVWAIDTLNYREYQDLLLTGILQNSEFCISSIIQNPTRIIPDQELTSNVMLSSPDIECDVVR
jgi:hypothetical protein